MARRTYKTLTQVDWLICNLRWLLLVSVGIVTVLNIAHSPLKNDLQTLLPLILLLSGVLYNTIVMIVLALQVPARPLPLVTVVLDALLSIGLIIASGGVGSPFLFFGLFPIITAALRFTWLAGLITALGIILAYSLTALLMLPPDTNLYVMLPVLLNAFILLTAALLTGALGDRMTKIVLQMTRTEEETERRKLNAAREQMRAIFEMAGTLGATLSYNRILDAILDVAVMGFNELGQLAHQMVEIVLLCSKEGLAVAAWRRLTLRDQQKTIPGRAGVIAQVLQSAEPVQSDDPMCDPELGQFAAMQRCKSVLCVPLRAGFETYGVVVIGSPEPGVFTPDHGEMLSAVCSQATIALQNAQLYQSLQQEKNRIVDIEENARKKLARDLHDGPTQSIAAIAMRLNYVRKLHKQQPDQVDEELSKIEEMARRTTKEIRHMLFTLRPLVLETQGLVAALQQSIQKVQEADPSVALHLEAPPNIEDCLDRNTQGVVYYIIEEAVGNARKHARANNIWVRLKLEPDAFVAQVQDDGEGFDVGRIASAYEMRGSLGMVNMRERAELINGILALDSQPGQGTTVTLAVPLGNPKD